jgi:hypothetical protein
LFFLGDKQQKNKADEASREQNPGNPHCSVDMKPLNKGESLFLGRLRGSGFPKRAKIG